MIPSKEGVDPPKKEITINLAVESRCKYEIYWRKGTIDLAVESRYKPEMYYRGKAYHAAECLIPASARSSLPSRCD